MEYVELKSLCTLITKGTTPTTLGRRFAEKGINFIKSESIGYDGSIQSSAFAHIDEPTHAELKRSQIAESDILYTIAGVHLGKCASARKEHLPANTNQAVAIIRVDPARAVSRFVEYVLRNRSFVAMVNAGVAQSAQPNVNLTEIGRFQIPLLPLAEQRAIAHILGALDDKIELNRRMNETLEAMARAIFKSWFVAFDPVRAKSEGCKPYGMNVATAALFPSSFQDSPLGKIPKGWAVAPIGEATQVTGGSTPKTDEARFWEEGTYYFATPKDLSQVAGPILLATERKITEAGLAQIGSGLLPSGTVLLSSRAPIGYTAITDVPVAVNQGIAAMKCNAALPNHYVYFWTKENLDTIISHANGSTFLEISKGNFRRIEAVVPPVNVVKAFRDLVAPMFLRITNDLKESQTLAALRDTLLPKLISGEIRIVPDSQVEEPMPTARSGDPA